MDLTRIIEVINELKESTRNQNFTELNRDRINTSLRNY